MEDLIFGIAIGFFVGMLFTIPVNNSWTSDCEHLGKHLSFGTVYLCEPVKK